MTSAMRKYAKVPLRLTESERELLQLLVAALQASEYTNQVDDIVYRGNREERMIAMIDDLLGIITGLMVATGTASPQMKELEANQTIRSTLTQPLQVLIEIFRRHKRLNQDANRSEYGKLLLILQDVQRRSVDRVFGLKGKLVSPILTVGDALKAIGCEELMSNSEKIFNLAVMGTAEERESARRELLHQYAKRETDRNTIERCIRSVEDMYQTTARTKETLRWLMRMLKRRFSGEPASSKHNLSIRSGVKGSTLTHSHESHYQYVLESLSLWEAVHSDIFEFWRVAEEDMIDAGDRPYNLANTGQGFHRVHQAPKSYELIAGCVNDVHRALGGWVGSKVIHLGDRDVPNSLVFIDKYAVIPHIVHPIRHTIESLEEIFDTSTPEEFPGIRKLLVDKYHSLEELTTMILADFFRHGFDGSGDNGGSCIDGRLTSVWNWCQQLDKKPYYDAFIITGFTGFQ